MRRALLLTLLLLSACTPSSPAASPAVEAKSHFAECATLAVGGSELPALDLPCFSGGTVQVGQLRGPLVINFWATWCPPCIKELPAFQRLADRNTVPVLGVATDSPRDGAADMAEGLGVRMPMLYDEDGSFRRTLGEANLPVTLFVDGSGKVTRYVGPALTDETLGKLVAERLGVAS